MKTDSNTYTFDFSGKVINIGAFKKSLTDFPSFARKVIGDDGVTRLVNCCYAENKCGCEIIGNGTL